MYAGVRKGPCWKPLCPHQTYKGCCGSRLNRGAAGVLQRLHLLRMLRKPFSTLMTQSSRLQTGTPKQIRRGVTATGIGYTRSNETLSCRMLRWSRDMTWTLTLPWNLTVGRAPGGGGCPGRPLRGAVEPAHGDPALSAATPLVPLLSVRRISCYGFYLALRSSLEKVGCPKSITQT